MPESGGRHLFKASKPCLRSRRMLHASFWHHGAHDLALPSWWAAPAAFAHATGDVDERDRNQARLHHEPFLEFLYPEKTLALLRRLSAYGSDTPDPRTRPLLASSVRQFSTTQGQPPKSEHAEDEEAIKAKEDMREMLLEDTAEAALEKLLWSGESGKQELAWHLYSAVPEGGRTPQLHCDLLEYLEGGDSARMATRIIQLFDGTTPEDRRSSSYKITAGAYVALGLVGPAIQLVEEASQRYDSPYIGFDAVLGQTFRDRQWELCFRVFNTFRQQAERVGFAIEQWSRKKEVKNWDMIFGQAAEMTDPLDHVMQLLEHVRFYRSQYVKKEKSWSGIELFISGLLPPVMAKMIRSSAPADKNVWEFFPRVFEELQAIGHPTSDLYEYALTTMLSTPSYRTYTNDDKIHLRLYRNYRQLHLDDPSFRPPSRFLLHKMILQHGEQGSLNQLDRLVEDARLFHPYRPFTPDMLKAVIRYYADGGRVDRVQELFQELQTRFPESVNLRIITSLIHVHARRIDVAGAIEQFKRVTEEFHLVPDTACWNVLLNAFARADDLDGALECFNNCIASGMKPNLFTFAPMLNMCAARGDIEAFEALFSRAKTLGVPVETDRRARSGYVQVFLSAGEPEGAEAIARGMLQSWRAGTFGTESITHVWNLLLSHYGVMGALADSRRIHKEMIDHKIPLDSWSYGGLMRALVEAKQTNSAYKILRVTMPANKLRIYAYHYALVITGFLRENQVGRAQTVLRRMKQRGIAPTESLRQATMLATGVQELTEIGKSGTKDARPRLVALEEQLRAAIMADYGHEIAHDQPSMNRYIDAPELNNISQGYFALVVFLYSRHGAFDICKQLFEAASKFRGEHQGYEAPISLLTAIMDAHFGAGEHDDIKRCWLLARKEASRLVKTFQQIMNPQAPASDIGSLTDPALLERFENSRIATNRRQILFHATRIYIRSLLAQNNPAALQEAQQTVRSLLSDGFLIDNLTWNELIQYLATHDHILDAFSACELYLMPQFPGWASILPRRWRESRPGYQWMQAKSYNINRKSMLPRYKTLVVLAGVFAKMKRDEANGLGFLHKQGKWATEVLQQASPMTVSAIESMPRTGDKVQAEFLLDA